VLVDGQSVIDGEEDNHHIPGENTDTDFGPDGLEGRGEEGEGGEDAERPAGPPSGRRRRRRG
jgi:hypothetical protein